MDKFGPFLTLLRTRAGIGLRTFAEMADLQPSNLCDLEHGRRRPTQDAAKLLEMASLLGLVEGTPDWGKFFDLAREADQLPADVRHMAQQPLIPVLLRTIDNRQLSEEELNNLIQHVQQGRRD